MDALAWETAAARRHLADDYDEGRYCKIYDRNDFFTVLVQILLALFALVALWYKRLSESPRRTFSTWFMDVFKQALGACYAHVLNMVRGSTAANR
jgi:hypothetical protein